MNSIKLLNYRMKNPFSLSKTSKFLQAAGRREASRSDQNVLAIEFLQFLTGRERLEPTPKK